MILWLGGDSLPLTRYVSKLAVYFIEIMLDFLAEYGLLGLFIGSFLAATVVPFSADVLLVGMLVADVNSAVALLVVATLGNWIGGITSYGIGRAGKWEWIERLHVSRESLEKQKTRIERFGAPIALLTWVPFIGDVFAVALGFYRVKFLPAIFWMLIGKGARFVCWYLIFS